MLALVRYIQRLLSSSSSFPSGDEIPERTLTRILVGIFTIYKIRNALATSGLGKA